MYIFSVCRFCLFSLAVFFSTCPRNARLFVMFAFLGECSHFVNKLAFPYRLREQKTLPPVFMVELASRHVIALQEVSVSEFI